MQSELLDSGPNGPAGRDVPLKALCLVNIRAVCSLLPRCVCLKMEISISTNRE